MCPRATNVRNADKSEPLLVVYPRRLMSARVRRSPWKNIFAVVIVRCRRKRERVRSDAFYSSCGRPGIRCTHVPRVLAAHGKNKRDVSILEPVTKRRFGPNARNPGRRNARRRTRWTNGRRESRKTCSARPVPEPGLHDANPTRETRLDVHVLKIVLTSAGSDFQTKRRTNGQNGNTNAVSHVNPSNAMDAARRDWNIKQNRKRDTTTCPNRSASASDGRRYRIGRIGRTRLKTNRFVCHRIGRTYEQTWRSCWCLRGPKKRIVLSNKWHKKYRHIIINDKELNAVGKKKLKWIVSSGGLNVFIEIQNCETFRYIQMCIIIFTKIVIYSLFLNIDIMDNV